MLLCPGGTTGVRICPCECLLKFLLYRLMQVATILKAILQTVHHPAAQKIVLMQLKSEEDNL